jgi:hypothetical protein
MFKQMNQQLIQPAAVKANTRRVKKRLPYAIVLPAEFHRMLTENGCRIESRRLTQFEFFFAFAACVLFEDQSRQ